MKTLIESKKYQIPKLMNPKYLIVVVLRRIVELCMSLAFFSMVYSLGMMLTIAHTDSMIYLFKVIAGILTVVAGYYLRGVIVWKVRQK